MYDVVPFVTVRNAAIVCKSVPLPVPHFLWLYLVNLLLVLTLMSCCYSIAEKAFLVSQAFFSIMLYSSWATAIIASFLSPPAFWKFCLCFAWALCFFKMKIAKQSLVMNTCEQCSTCCTKCEWHCIPYCDWTSTKAATTTIWKCCCHNFSVITSLLYACSVSRATL